MGVFIGVGYGQVTVSFLCAGIPTPMVFTHGFKDNLGTGLAVAAATAWNTALTGSGRPLIPANVSTSYTHVETKAVIGTPTGPVTGVVSPGAVGTLVAEAMPPNCAVLIRKATSRGGRRGRGRMYVPPFNVAEGNVGPAGTIASAQLSAIQTLWSNCLTQLNSGDYPPYLLHETSEVAPDAVFSWNVQARVATQRTRLRK